ncbi:hypothetical protein FRC17_000167 [Serendipita sp. 399]|nr:hypothetical protein FRC17_000167 [Serendipita sp. 399]
MGYDDMPRKSVDYLQLELPGGPEPLTGLPVVEEQHYHQQQQQQEFRRSVDVRKSMADGRKTPDGRRSIEPLARPSSELAQWNGTMFKDAEDDFDEEEEEHDMPEVNLASWGVDQYLTKKEEKPKSRSRASSINAYNRAASPGPSIHTVTRPRNTSITSAHTMGANPVPAERGANRRSGGYRTKSMGDWGRDDEQNEQQEGVAIPRTSLSSSGRARPTSVADMDYLVTPNQSHPPTAFLQRSGSVSALQQSVPFPAALTPEPAPNPFEIPLPSPTHTSRFDPKAIAHQRTISMASMGSRRAFQNAQGDAPDNVSVMTGGPRPEVINDRYSRADPLRPKVLVMPSPLQDQEEARPAQPQRNVRVGFQDSTDARPLPLGARASSYGLNAEVRSSMTLSQLTFRNSLMVGGQRDPAFADFESNLRRAQRDGEQIEQEMDPEPEIEEPIPYRAAGKLYGRSLMDDLQARKAQLKSKQRWVTDLELSVLLSDLSLNRVFRGDERPSMMQRPQPVRTSTLISEQDLMQNAMGTAPRPALSRSHSSGEPLVNFGNDPVPGTTVQARPQKGRAYAGMATSRSVFGVDQVWERELVKLKEIEAMEKAQEEEEKKIEEERKAKEEAKAAKKAAKKKAKGLKQRMSIGNLLGSPNGQQSEEQEDEEDDSRAIAPGASTSNTAAPSLPAVNPFPTPPKPDSSSESSDSEAELEERRAQSRMRRSDSRAEWLSDDERQAAMALQQQQAHRRPAQMTGLAAGLRVGGDDDSDEDVPLTSALKKAKERQRAEDSEEDVPLAAVLTQSRSQTLSTFDFGGTVLAEVGKTKPPAAAAHKARLMADSDSDDDKPLALQHSRPIPRATGVGASKAANGSDDEDEQPLGVRYSMAPSMMFGQPQQQQQQQMMQQQIMQQQMMAAAQMRSSMFNPIMGGGIPQMGYGGGGVGMNPMGMMSPAPAMNPAAMMQMQMQMQMMSMAHPGMGMGMGLGGSAVGDVDNAKLASVDRWRRDVGSAAD